MYSLTNFELLFETPGDTGNANGPKGDLTQNDVLKMLDDDTQNDEVIDLDDKKDIKRDKKDSNSKESGESNSDSEDSETNKDNKNDDSDLDELEDDLEDSDPDIDKEEELQLIAPARKKEILSKYPKLFDDFPYLQVAYYRDKQFTEVFPTVSEAREAKEGLETLARFDNDLSIGNIEPILVAALEADKSKQAFYSIVDNLLPALAKLDEKAHHHVIGNISKQIIQSMYQDGGKDGSEVLRQAAIVLNQYIFGSNEYTEPKSLAEKKTESPEINKLAEERKKFAVERFNIARDEISTKLDNSIRATLDQNIDPKGQMTDYVKKNAIRDAQEKLENIIRKDTRFRAVLGKLWRKASETNFNDESKRVIRSAYLGRAKVLLPGVLNQARRDALRGIGKKSISDEESDETIEKQTSRKGPIPSGGSTTSVNRGKSNSDGNSNDKKVIPSGMSIRDYLMQD